MTFYCFYILFSKKKGGNSLIKFIILLMISVSFSFGLTNEQIQKIQDVYTVGKNIKTSDGHTFEKTLVGIMGQESDWGDFFNYAKTKESQLKSPTSSIGDFQIQLATAQEVIKSNDLLLKKYGNMLYEGKTVYFKYENNKRQMEYLKKLINNQKLLAKAKNGDLKAQKQLKQATETFGKLQKDNISLIVNAEKDRRLINNLLHNHKFSADIAGHYLVNLYEDAKIRRLSNPFARSIGAYNGTWNNSAYTQLINKKISLLSDLRKKGEISF